MICKINQYLFERLNLESQKRTRGERQSKRSFFIRNNLVFFFINLLLNIPKIYKDLFYSKSYKECNSKILIGCSVLVWFVEIRSLILAMIVKISILTIGYLQKIVCQLRLYFRKMKRMKQRICKKENSEEK